MGEAAPEPKTLRYRVVGLQATVEIEVLNEKGQVKLRNLLGTDRGPVTVHLVEEHFERLGRPALMEILGEAGIRPTD